MTGCWRTVRQHVVGWVGLLGEVTHLSKVRWNRFSGVTAWSERKDPSLKGITQWHLLVRAVDVRGNGPVWMRKLIRAKPLFFRETGYRVFQDKRRCCPYQNARAGRVANAKDSYLTSSAGVACRLAHPDLRELQFNAAWGAYRAGADLSSENVLLAKPQSFDTLLFLSSSASAPHLNSPVYDDLVSIQAAPNRVDFNACLYSRIKSLTILRVNITGQNERIAIIALDQKHHC